MQQTPPMTINVTWDNDEKTTIRYDFAANWMWQEFDTAIDSGYQMMSIVPHTVDNIINSLESSKMPIGKARRIIAETQHARAGTSTRISL